MAVNILPVDAWNLNAPNWAKAELINDPTKGQVIAMYGERDAFGNYKRREVDSAWLPLNVGDLMVMRAEMRTDPATVTPQFSNWGARFGLNMMGDYAYHTTDHSPEGWFISPWVAMGTPNYTFREVLIRVPQKLTSFLPVPDSNPPVYEEFTPRGFIAWLQVYTGVRNNATIEEMGIAYFANTELYINEEPTTPPPPPTNKSIAARVPSLGNSALVQTYMRRLRDKFISEELHKKIHPVV